MPADELCRRMHHDIGALLDRAAEIGRGKGVVDDQRHPGLVRDLRHRRDIEAH